MHTYCIRVNVKTGDRQTVEFGEIDGKDFAATNEWKKNKAFHSKIALLIVNRWNYVSQMQNTIEWLYYLPTVEGTC